MTENEEELTPSARATTAGYHRADHVLLRKPKLLPSLEDDRTTLRPQSLSPVHADGAVGRSLGSVALTVNVRTKGVFRAITHGNRKKVAAAPQATMALNFCAFWPQTAQAAKESKKENSEVARLKQQLLEVVGPTERGVSTTAGQREKIDRLITALEPLNPNASAVTEESLSALWILQWTTEREILFLMEKGLLGLPSGPVQQNIDVDSKTLSNTMLFGSDSKFEVFSSITPEATGPRVNFEFEACKLRYRGFTLPLPPVGKGWFESVYLDEDFRVTRDVRGDVTVLSKSQD